MTKNLNLGKIVPEFRQAKNKKEIKAKVGKFVVEQINRFLDGSISPVSKGQFKKFNADKSASQLFESGDMRSAIEAEPVPGGVKIGIFSSTEAPKAFNHNTGDTLPVRKFIPSSEETFKKPILDGIKRIIREEIDV